MSESNKQLESLEERQWRLKVEQARARITEEENEWKTLLARAQHASQHEEREWARLRSRAELKSSGAFLAHPDEAATPPRAPAERTRR